MRSLLLLIYCFLFGFSVKAQPLRDTAITSTPYFSDKITIQHIFISGNQKTKEGIILREMSMEEGAVIDRDSLKIILEINWQRVYNTTLFTDVKITVDTIDHSRMNIEVAVKERWYIFPEITFKLADRNFNVWWTEQNRDIRRSVIGITLKHHNFRGNREQIGITAQIGYRQEYSFSYIKPFIDKQKKHGAGLEAGMSNNNEIFYKTDSNKLLFAHQKEHPIIQRYWVSGIYTYRPKYASTYTFRTTFIHTKVDDTIISLNPEYHQSGSPQMSYLELSGRWDLNRVDNWNYPLTGEKMVAHIFSNIGLKGMDFFTYALLEVGKFNRLYRKWYSSFIFRGKASFPNNQPYVMRQGLGTKYEYVRGYELYVIDGYHYGLLRSNLKYELLNFTIKKIPFKYLPVIPVRVYPKIFIDGGYVANPTPGNSYLNNRILYSAGAGIDIFTAYDFKVRIEYAINHLGQKGLFLHFNSE